MPEAAESGQPAVESLAAPASKAPASKPPAAGAPESTEAHRKTAERNTSADPPTLVFRAVKTTATKPAADPKATPASKTPADSPFKPAADPAKPDPAKPAAEASAAEERAKPAAGLGQPAAEPPAPPASKAPANGAPESKTAQADASLDPPTLVFRAVKATAKPAADPKAKSASKTPADPPAKPAAGQPASKPPARSLPDGPPTQPTLILTAYNAPPALPASKAPAESPAEPAAGETKSADATPAAQPVAGPENKASADSAKKEKPRSSRFGSAPAVRPDVLTDAETVVLPQLESDPAKTPGQPGASAKSAGITVSRSSGNAGTVDRQQSGQAAVVKSRAVAPDNQTQFVPAAASSPVARERPAGRYRASRRTSMISRAVLLGILCLQAIMSLRLRNTAFQDEALYLYAGRMELEHMLHGASLYGNFSSYFPGAPVLYPVVAAALNQTGGLALARALSLVEMLAVTALCYSIARYLFNERVGLCTAALFSVAESTLFLCNFATMDATSLFLLAAAAWIMVFSARTRWPVFLLAAPVAALAVAVKYSGVLWIPTIAVLPALTAWPDRIRRVWLYPVCFLVVVAGLLAVGLRLGGHLYVTAIKSTTTDPVHGTISVLTVLADSLKWGGVLFVLAVFGSVAYVWRVHTETGEKIAPAGGRLRRAVLGLILTATALLAPAYQAHLHSVTALQTYLGFGLFFAAPMAGFGLVRIMGDYIRWPQVGIAIFSVALVLGLLQSSDLYHGWPQSTTFVSAFSRYLKPNANYLVEVPNVPIYYLQGRSDAQPKQFTSTYSVAPLDTPAKFAAAVKDGEFQVIAYNDDLTPATDEVLAKALKASSSYTLEKKVYIGYAYGSSPYYYIWVKHTPAKATTPAKAKAKT